MAEVTVTIGPQTTSYYRPLTFTTDEGDIECRYYHGIGEKRAVIFLGDSKNGWSSPANDLYPTLSKDLQLYRISSLQVKYRNPSDLFMSVFDVIAAIRFLESIGVTSVGLVGYSFGAAVAMQAAALSDAVRAVVALGAQSFGAEIVRDLPPYCSTLFIHGENDKIHSYEQSVLLYELANEPKELLLYPDASHTLSEVATKMNTMLRTWLVEKLRIY